MIPFEAPADDKAAPDHKSKGLTCTGLLVISPLMPPSPLKENPLTYVPSNARQPNLGLPIAAETQPSLGDHPTVLPVLFASSNVQLTQWHVWVGAQSHFCALAAADPVPRPFGMPYS